MSEMLGRKADAEEWRNRAEERKERIQRYLWDGEQGLYFDYDFENGKRSTYEYVTAFFPLWAGIPTPEHARAVMQHLHTFAKPGGVEMSTLEHGSDRTIPTSTGPESIVSQH